MDVRFREVDPFNCWVWLRFADVPSQGERNYVDGIFDSWYVNGGHGGGKAVKRRTKGDGGERRWEGENKENGTGERYEEKRKKR